ncbi:hypothetical protein NHX12_021456 [Muraenolepis orangiensis]|uniref:Uncharacterized protein n=1 Tax=Muraenolepis orangiensis TaxID=630683 RepID=A0A9Q0IW45_9TELE|nr:hypothetical protein NHX12_021456 [Muraenolepis orangiensis]
MNGKRYEGGCNDLSPSGGIAPPAGEAAAGVGERRHGIYSICTLPPPTRDAPLICPRRERVNWPFEDRLACKRLSMMRSMVDFGLSKVAYPGVSDPGPRVCLITMAISRGR